MDIFISYACEQRTLAEGTAHAFWAHALMATGENVAAAKTRFEQALASSTQRAFVRQLQIGATLWQRDPAREDVAVRIAADMHARGEALPASAAESLASSLWSVYQSRRVRGDGRERFLEMLPAPDHLATYLWLFPAYYNTSNR